MLRQSLGTNSEITSVLHMFSQVMSKKVNITLTIRPELKELAEKFEINLSALLEDALIQCLRDLILIKQGKEVMLRPGFEPGSRDRESRMIGRATPPEHSQRKNSRTSGLYISFAQPLSPSPYHDSIHHLHLP